MFCSKKSTKMATKKLILLLVITAAVLTVQVNSNEITQQQSKGNFCQGCRSIVSFVGNFNSSENRDEYKSLMKTFCDFYYPPSTDFQQGPCPWVVNGFFELMDRMDPVEHCDQIGACGPSTFATQPPSDDPRADLDGDGVCGVCQQLVNQVKTMLDDPEAISQLRTQMDAFCDFLKVIDLNKQCKREANKYIDQAVTFIKNIDPVFYCKSLGLCSAARKDNQIEMKFRPQLPSLADFNRFGIETSRSIGPNVEDIKLEESRPSFGPNCALCKTVVKELFKFLKENRTEANIKTGLDKVCQFVFHHNEDKINECEQMVSAYTKELIEFLAAETDPDLVCILIDQCTYQKSDKSNKPSATVTSLEVVKSPEVKNMGEFINKLDSSKAIGSFEACIECKVFIKYLRDLVDKPHTEESIKDYIIQHLCDNLEDNDLKQSCTQMINSYANIFFQAVAQELDPESACVALQACKGKTEDFIDAIVYGNKIVSASQRTQLKPLSPISLEQCQTCLDVVEQVDRYIATSPNVDDVSILVDKVCPTLSFDCKDMITRSGLDIVHEISAMKEPNQICNELKYCEAS